MGSHKNGAKIKIHKDGEFTKGEDKTNDMQPSTVQWNTLAQNRKTGWRDDFLKFGVEIKRED